MASLDELSLRSIAETYGTPVFVYEQKIIEERIKELKQFDVIRYAQKACSNLSILALLKSRGVVVDAVSAGEIVRALKAGYVGGIREDYTSDIVFTSDLLDRDALELVAHHRIPVNIGSPDMIDQLGEAYPGAPVLLRINPGFGHGHSRKTNTGGPFSKHGIWHEELQGCIERIQARKLKLYGLHMHIGSGSDLQNLSKVCESMVACAREVGESLRVISAGGGVPVPYRQGEGRMPLDSYVDRWRGAKREIERSIGHEVTLEIEPGRYLVAEAGILLAEIRAIKNMGKNLFYLVDAGFDNLVRPSMYGAWHEISVVSRDGGPLGAETDVIVAGPLCESGDVFTQGEGGIVMSRLLPTARVGDYVVFHTAGAYGASMSSNYNTRRLAPEVLVREDGVHCIRERQSWDAILQFESLLVP